LDAEVRYAIRNEYAITAIDVLARRTRLSFLNARAALDALPRVVDIMAEELQWSYAERQRQIANTVKFLESMGLTAPPSTVPAPIPRGFLEKAREEAKRAGLWVLGYGRGMDITVESFGPGRSRFEAGEMAALRQAFAGKAKAAVPTIVSGDGDVAELKVQMDEVMDILKSVPGYPEISKKELDYVVAEAGMDGQTEVDLDEFIEVRFLSCFPSLVDTTWSDELVLL
jgi:glycerol-3-phosphate dehydrogenase